MLVDKQEAARRLGVSVDTIERRLKKGDLQGQREQRGKGWRWLIEVAADDAPATAPANNGDAPASAPAENPLVTALQDQIAGLQEQLRVMNQALSSRDNQIVELITVVRTTQAMLPPPAPESQPPAPATERKSWWRRFWDS